MSDAPLAVVRAINAAWARGRAREELPELFTDEAVIVGPDLAPLAIGRDACVQSYVEFEASIDLVEFEEFDPRVYRFGSTVVADYAYRAVYRRDGEELTDFGRDVIVVVETVSGWRAAWRMARPDL